MENPEVIIVGAGPTGLMMACQLIRQNISFRIIDKTGDHTSQSRAIVIQARSLEIFDQMGIAEKAVRQGKIAKAAGAFFNGKKILSARIDNAGKGLTKFPYLLMLEQSRTEHLLVEFLKERGYEVERNTELIGLSQNTEQVTSILKLPSGLQETVTCKFVIGADGAHSAVRKLLNIPFAGKTYQDSLFVMDCKADVDLPPDEMYLAFSEGAFGGFFPLTNGRYRIVGSVPRWLEEKEEILFEDIAKNFGERVKVDTHLYDPRWVSAYNSHHRYASTFMANRCFLIGDAAHIHSPVGAQGMNTGLQDAYNLAWKIVLVLKGKTNFSLLKTYTAERITIAKNLVRSTDMVFHFITSDHIALKAYRMYVLPILLYVLSPLLKRVNSMPLFLFKRVSEIGINYRRSTISNGASFGHFPSNAPKPGDRLPFIDYESPEGEGTNIQNIVKDTFFTLLVFSNNVPEELTAAVKSYSDILTTRIIPLTTRSEVLFKRFGIKKSGFYLIRPDTYIACRSQSTEARSFKRYLEKNLSFLPVA